LVSVIIPNYNHALFLQRRIESVLSQTYIDFELIILDDFSVDHSRDVIEGYRDHPKVSHIAFNESNSGSTFKQWNKGIGLAKGEYIWIAESDDYAHPKFLSSCMERIQNDDRIGLVYTDSFEVTATNDILGRWSRWQTYLHTNLWQQDFYFGGDEFNARYQYTANMIPNASCAVFKKEAYLQSPFLRSIEDFRFTGDWLMWFSILQFTDGSYCHQPLNYFRYHSATTRATSANRLSNVKEHYQTISMLRKMVTPAPDKNIREKKFTELYAFWNPSVKFLLSLPNLKILRRAFGVDPRIVVRLLKTIFNKLYAI